MIGIIGIAAILALSSGVNNYIDQIQYDTMSSYTITVSRTTVDLNAMLAAGGMGGLGGSSGSGSSSSSGGSTSQDMTKVHADYSDIKQSEAVSNSIKSNNLNDFKKYLDNPNSDIHQYLGENGVVYSYDVNFSVLATNPDGGLIDADADADALSAGSVNGGSGSSGLAGSSGSSGLASENGAPSAAAGGMAGMAGASAGGAGNRFGASGGMGSIMSAMTGSSNNSSASNFSQLMPGQNGEPVSAVTRDSYDLLDGSWPSKATDVVLVLDDNNAIPSGILYQLGLISADQYREAADAIADDKEDWSYDELVGRTLTLVNASDRYVDNGNGTFSYRETSDSNMSALKDSGLELKVSGVVRPAKDAQNATISTAVGYTQQLTDWMIDHTDSSAVVQAQEASADTDVLTGAVFADETGENGSSVKNTYDDNLEAFGKVSRDAPSSISIYTDSFDDKEAVADCIKAYNKGKDEDHAITYTDYVALMTSSITSIVNIITYVLIAFVAVSLVVSCVMIGIITHISVMERTKGIGILRALGASKHNVSQVFNAETIIIGLCSGLLGVGLTALLTIPANDMVANLLGSGGTLTISYRLATRDTRGPERAHHPNRWPAARP